MIDHCDDSPGQERLNRHDLKYAFSSISNHSEFGGVLQTLKSSLNVPKLSLWKAIDSNVEWRAQTFGARSKSKDRLGQSLTVLEDRNVPAVRKELQQHLVDELQTGKDIVLSGDEGHGNQPRVHKRRACLGDRRRRVERLHPQDRRYHANHRERVGRAVKRGPASIRDYHFGLVYAGRMAG